MRITLTAEEQGLFDGIEFEPSRRGDLQGIAATNGERAAALMGSLARRKAIPEVRLRYFTDPELNVGAAKSRQQVLIDSGTAEREIPGHPDFLRHLYYFVCGPRLPASVVAEWKMIATAPSPDLEQFRRLVRARARTFDAAADPGEEFFKLAVENGMELEAARTIRSDGKNAAAAARRIR